MDNIMDCFNDDSSIDNKMSDMLDRMRGGIILCNFDLNTQSSIVIYSNYGWSEITGYTPEQLQSEKGGNPQALILEDDKKQSDEDYARQMAEGNTYELMYRIIHRSGGIRWVIDKGIVKSLPNNIMQNLSVVTEITKIKEQEEAMKLLAQQDQLTEVNNKATFNTLSKNILEKQNNSLHALLMLDIDDFKDVNDCYGHAVGDRVLEEVAIELKERFRSRDIVGRVGGDEFTILMTDIPSKEVAIKKAEELCTAVRKRRFTKCEITVSIGIAFASDEKSFNEIYNEADEALYQAKNNGKNQFQMK